MSLGQKNKNLNDGEREEYLIKIYLCYLRDQNIEVPTIGKITNVGFENDYKTTDWSNINFKELKDNQKDIKLLAKILDITKSSSRDKADIRINNIFYSLKCTGYGKPTIVNHTNRIGWLKIAEIKNLDISILDKIIEKYWELRIKGDISEDCPNFHNESPFNLNKKVIKPYLDFFIFEGSGQGYSKFPASKVLDFKSFDDLDSWRIYGEEYLEKHWNKLYFCMRYKKNIMPLDKKSFDNHKFKELISPWTRHFKGKKGEKKYRGALHVRVG